MEQSNTHKEIKELLNNYLPPKKNKIIHKKLCAEMGSGCLYYGTCKRNFAGGYEPKHRVFRFFQR